jgi:hypothetical protein
MEYFPQFNNITMNLVKMSGKRLAARRMENVYFYLLNDIHTQVAKLMQAKEDSELEQFLK